MTTLPNFNKANFVPGQSIDNLYFPLKPGTVYVYEGEPIEQGTGDQIEETNKFAVTFQKENIAGVSATVVRDTAWANGFLQEDTTDWFAQDKQGNVWYLGEFTTSYEYDENGNFIGTNNNGSWKTGVNGAKPGYIMEANPQVGDNYYQEFAPNDRALDQAEVTSRNQTLVTELGTVNNVLQTLESTQVEPGVFGFKYNAPGIGLVYVEELDENLKPVFSAELESITSVTPESFTKATKGNDALDGDNKDNTLNGGQGDDFLRGFDGNDLLLGKDGKDFLVGGNGLDTLKGGNGQDILIGGKGADILSGGNGKDQFILRTLDDKGDLIKDFTSQDVIVLAEIFDSANYGSSNPFDDYLQFQQVVSSTVIRIDSDGDLGSHPFEVLATLQNTNANLLSENNFVL